MKRYLLRVQVEPLEGGRYLAVCQELQGCHAEGDTIAEALENVEDVARVIIELCMEKGLPLPAELSGAGEMPVVKAEVVVRVGS
jgi:predicted RNase H-like HicB family nuclease